MTDNRDERDNPYEPVDTPGHEQPATSAAPTEPSQGQPTATPAEAPDAPPATSSTVEDERDLEDTWTDTPSVAAPSEGGAPAARGADPDTPVTSTFDVREAAHRPQPGGAHEAERPVPRSGLAEYHSAGYLTGERRPAEEDTTAVEQQPPATGAAAAPTWLGDAPDAAPADAEDRARRAVVLDGTTAVTRPPSRAGAHALTVLVTLLLTPVAWYLLADAGARLTLARANPWETGDLNVAALLELAGGLLVLAVVLLAARWSSVGAIVTGSIVFLLGVPFVAAPAWTQEALEPVVSWLERLDELGGNVAHHLAASGSTGRLLVVGAVLVLVGVVSHGARRKGRHEVRPVVENG